MKKLCRLFAILLCFAMVLPMAAQAVTYPTDGYVFPEDWSKDALVFAVSRGLLQGNENHDLLPGSNMTRAEMAAVIVRILGATETADISAYTDVPADAWFHEVVAVSAALGVFNGTSPTTMAPNAFITREQAMVVISRAFGMFTEDSDTCDRFLDADKISGYARGAVSTLTEMGIVGGYPDGTVRPGSFITRAEVAQVFYKLLAEIADLPGEIPESGRVVYRGTEPLPDGLTLDGTLYLAPTLSGTVTIPDWTITEQLVLRCAAGSDISLPGTDVQTLTCIMNGAQVSASGNIDRLDLRGTNTTVTASPFCAYISGTGNRLAGNAGDVVVDSADAVLDGDYTSVTLKGTCHVTLNGNAGLVTIEGPNCTLSGTGYADKVTEIGRNPTVSLSCGELEDRIDRGLQGVSAVVTQEGILTTAKGEITVTATFSGGVFEGTGTVGGTRLCDLVWYCGNVKVAERSNFTLVDGATATQKIFYDIAGLTAPTGAVSVRLVYGEDQVTAKTDVKYDDALNAYLNARSTVKTPVIPATLKYNETLYRSISNGRKDPVCSVAKGTTVQVICTQGSDYAYVRCDNGSEGWVWYKSCTFYPNNNYTDSANDYSVLTKEGFVDLGKYASDTQYLIWVSLQTQHVNIFEGSQGNWKLIQSFLCGTGSNLHPTPTCVCKTTGLYDDWKYERYHVINVTKLFDGYAFHSILLNYNGTVNNGSLGAPISHGCIRLSVADSRYIYEMPIGTTVVIY